MFNGKFLKTVAKQFDDRQIQENQKNKQNNKMQMDEEIKMSELEERQKFFTNNFLE